MATAEQKKKKKLNDDARATLVTETRFKELVDNPEKVVDLYAVYETLWRKYSGNENPTAEKYSRSMVQSIYENYSKIADYGASAANIAAAVRNTPRANLYLAIGALGGSIFRDFAIHDKSKRRELGEEILAKEGDRVKAIIEGLQYSEYVMAMVITTPGTDPKLVEAARDNLARIGEFTLSLESPGMNAPDSILLAKAPAYAFELLEGAFEAATATGAEKGSPEYESALYEALSDIGEIQSDLKGLKAALDQAAVEAAAAADVARFKEKVSEARGWGNLVGMLVGIRNPEAGNAITAAVNGACDAYEAFSMLGANGAAFSAATFATGVGGVLAVYGAISALSRKKEEDRVTQALFEALSSLGEQIYSLHVEVVNARKDIANFSDSVAAQFSIINAKLDGITEIVRKFRLQQVESSLQDALNRIDENFNRLQILGNDASRKDFRETVFKIYQIGTVESCSLDTTGMFDSPGDLFDYLSMPVAGDTGTFRWSPLERRPVLLERLRRYVVENSDSAEELRFRKWSLRELHDYIDRDIPDNNPNFDCVNPIILSAAAVRISKLVEQSVFIPQWIEDTGVVDLDIDRFDSVEDVLQIFGAMLCWVQVTTAELADLAVLRAASAEYSKRVLSLIGKIAQLGRSGAELYARESFGKYDLDALLLSATSTVNSLRGTEFDFSCQHKAGDAWLLEGAVKDSTLSRIYGKEADRLFDLLGACLSLGCLSLETEDMRVLNGYPEFFQRHCTGKGDFWLKLRLKVNLDAFSPELRPNGKESMTIEMLDKRRGVAALAVGSDVSTYRVKFAPRVNQDRLNGVLPSDYTFPVRKMEDALTCPGPLDDFGYEQLLKYFNGGIERAYSFSTLERVLNEAGVDITLNVIRKPYTVDDIPFDLYKWLYEEIFLKAILSARFRGIQMMGAGFSLQEDISAVREAWVNLAAALLCRSYATGDSAPFTNLVLKKPLALSNNLPILGREFLGAFSGQNLDDLLLGWTYRVQYEVGDFADLQFPGIHTIRAEDWGGIDGEVPSPTIWMLSKDGTSVPSELVLHGGDFEVMTATLSGGSEFPIVQGSALPDTSEAFSTLMNFAARTRLIWPEAPVKDSADKSEATAE